MSVDRAELLVAAGNAYLAGRLDAGRLQRAFALRTERHLFVAMGGTRSEELASLLSGVRRLRVAGPERAAVLGADGWREWTAEPAFAAGRWRVTWHERASGPPPTPPTVGEATAALAVELDAALASLAAASRDARVLRTARATLQGEPSPTASPIRRLRTRLRRGPPEAPRANAIAAGELPAAYPEPARRLFRAAVESERTTPVAAAARAAALAALAG